MTSPRTLRRHSLFVLALGFSVVACAKEQAAPAFKAPAPAAEPEPVEVSYVPAPSADEIRQAINDRNAALRQCYMMGTFRDSQLAGTVNVTFTIDTSGRVSQTSGEGSDLPDQEVVQCVLGVFTQLEFRGGAASETEVTYPVHFGNG